MSRVLAVRWTAPLGSPVNSNEKLPCNTVRLCLSPNFLTSWWLLRPASLFPCIQDMSKICFSFTFLFKVMMTISLQWWSKLCLPGFCSSSLTFSLYLDHSSSPLVDLFLSLLLPLLSLQRADQKTHLQPTYPLDSADNHSLITVESPHIHSVLEVHVPMAIPTPLFRRDMALF